MRIFSFYALKNGWLTMPGWIYSAPFLISTKHINWTTSVGTWLPSAEHQAGELRVNKMEAQTWSIHVKNYMVTSSFYDDQYKELFFDLCNLLYNICVIMYKKTDIFLLTSSSFLTILCFFLLIGSDNDNNPRCAPWRILRG